MISRTLTASVAALALVVAACGDDDDGGGGNAAEFCSLITEDSPVFAENADEQETIVALRQLVDLAPGDIKGDVEALLEANEELAEIDFNELSDEEFVALSERFEGLEENQRNAEAWVLENCDNVSADFFE